MVGWWVDNGMGGRVTRLGDAFSMGVKAVYLGWLSLYQSYDFRAQTLIYFNSNLSVSTTRFSRNSIWFSVVNERTLPHY